MINPTVPPITKKSLLFEFDKIRLVKLLVIQRAIKYPIIVPTVFVIISFTSVVLKVRIWDISITNDIINPIRAAPFIFLNLPHNVGKKKPNGTNKSIFKQALTKSDTISTNGITFTVKSIRSDVILGKPTSTKIAIK